MKGNVVITNRDESLYREALRTLEAAYDTGVIDKWSKTAGKNLIIWKFSQPADAADSAKQFMELGFEFVQRLI